MNPKQGQRLLAIGPLPPPLAGTSVSFDLFREFIQTESKNLDLLVINSAPDEVGERALVSFRNLRTAVKIIGSFVAQIRRVDSTIIFCNDQFLISLMPLCLFIAKIFRKPCFIRCFGGSLDQYYEGLPGPIQHYIKYILNRSDGLIVQTEELKVFFGQVLSAPVIQIPGYRKISALKNSAINHNSVAHSLKLIYVGHIREEKGIFDLIEGLKQLSDSEQEHISCDLFGPIYSEVEEKFASALKSVSSIKYRGILPHNDVAQTIADYDVFVFPSYYKGEGHAGVIIEAMMAGIPIITTRFKSLPELIRHNDNGLLVEPHRPEEILDCVRQLSENGELRSRLAKRARETSSEYSSTLVIPKLIAAINL